MRQWFIDHEKCNETDVKAIEKRFIEIHADEQAKYGLFWQDYSVDDIRCGQKLNLKNRILQDLIMNLDQFGDISLEFVGKQRLEKQWKQLQESGEIPPEIPEEIRHAGSKHVKPLKNHYEIWTKQFQTRMTASEYQKRFMQSVNSVNHNITSRMMSDNDE